MAGFNNIDPARIVIFPNCIDMIYPSSNSKSPYEKGKFNILSVTRLDIDDNYKGIDNIIKTLPVLIDKIPNIQYTVIGKGNDRERLEKLAQTLNVTDCVTFKGFVDEIEPYYEYCDLFALPSNGEGFGIVYLEAMKYRKPIIAANARGATDVVIDNETGLLCDYDDKACLSERMYELYVDIEKRQEFGANGYQYLIENFTF